MPLSVHIDPLVPQGNESLKTGPSRIQALAKALLTIFGLPVSAPGDFLSPIQAVDANGLATVWGDPVTALGVATAQYADRKAVSSTVTSADGITYQGTTDPILTTFSRGIIYAIFNAGQTNAGNVIIQLNQAQGGQAVQLLRRDGTQLSPGELAQNALYLCAFDGTQMRVMDFIGGTLTQSLILAGDPTKDLGAATKQYVDSSMRHPVRTSMTAGSVNCPAGTITDVLSASFVVPADGSYLIATEHLAHALVTNPHTGRDIYAWLTDGSQYWGVLGGQFADEPNASGIAFCTMSATGQSPIIYPANTHVMLTLQAQSTDGCTVERDPIQPSQVGKVPQTFLQYMLQRVSM